MKTALLATALALLAAGPLAPASAAADAPRTTVSFDHPEKFTDVKDSDIPTEKGRDAILGQIERFIVQTGDRLMAPGWHLAMNFTDIDLAGDFEPWHGPQWDDVRIVKDIYPPRFKFSYSVTNPAGQVVKQGSENLADLNFQLEAVINRDDPLRYEKAFLGDWMRSHFAHLKG